MTAALDAFDPNVAALGRTLACLYILTRDSPDGPEKARAAVIGEWDRIQQVRPSLVAFDMGAFLDRMDATLGTTR